MLHRRMYNHQLSSMFNLYGPLFVLFVGVVSVCSSFLSWHGLVAALCQRQIEYILYVG